MYVNKNKGEYLYFKVSNEGYIQEILEKIIIEIYSEDNYDSLMLIEVLKYIDKNYATASLLKSKQIGHLKKSMVIHQKSLRENR